ncbi:hypothetical protein AGABI1DRAFT_127334 [Agaricus bisporus var. burnettii JB137-S8]|uniref:Uncharacterized protein n=1 Tax=Agaricus bisporus var. burnettii (strain JB137-S8 / ATCC MYA-4627 / FGSC 10392) TaxID=597362 RepID=K5Y0M8_AGABU|nr:uncharacterized protein AGABI1DRAFT_127334 [Agaricus bisporus var. burnettii JB137-S8]EKM81325.1 hypothetical protein AGABI1DRAFT_127334 [Agaricus bisporus var. burnettii JB137-S8]
MSAPSCIHALPYLQHEPPTAHATEMHLWPQVEHIWADLNGGMDRLPDLADTTAGIRANLFKKAGLRHAIAEDNAADFNLHSRPRRYEEDPNASPSLFVMISALPSSSSNYTIGTVTTDVP